jgi:CelD/BcsL family acetyltransferase involved in cellulose biosynthesis
VAESGLRRVELRWGEEAFFELEADWRNLTATSQNPFLRWEWVSAWIRSGGSGRTLTAVVRDGGRPDAIAPLFQNVYGLGFGVAARALQLFGPRERHHIFEMREVAGAAARDERLLEMIGREALAASGFDWIELAGCQEVGFERVRDYDEPVPTMRLPESWDALRGRLRRNLKENIRHSYNSLRREGRKFRVQFAADPESSPPLVEEFLRLHSMRAASEAAVSHGDAFLDPANARFLRVVVPSMMAAGVLRIARLEVDGEVVASRLFMDVNGCRYLYYSGFDPAWWRYGVMTLLTTEIIRDAIDSSVERVNFSPGSDRSKTRWDVSNDWVHAFSIAADGAVSKARLRALRMRKRLTGRLRRSRTFRPLYVRLRRSRLSRVDQ